MKILEIDSKEFLEAFEDSLKEKGILDNRIELMIMEAEARINHYILPETKVYKIIACNYLIIMGEVLIILRNNHVRPNNESLILETLGNYLTPSVEDNPYM